MMATEIWLNPIMNNIVFEGRNKSYGAFALRESYNKNMARAMLTGISFFLVCFSIPGILKHFDNSRLIEEPVLVFTPVDLAQKFDPPVDRPKIEIAKPIRATTPVIKFIRPQVNEDDKVMEEELPPAQNDLVEKSIGTTTITNEDEGIDPGLQEFPGEPQGENPILQEDEGPMLDIIVEQKPEFPGGQKALFKYIQDHFEIPEMARSINGDISVTVKFVIDKEGFVREVVVARSPSVAIERAAREVVENMPQWKAGKHNGKPVKVILVLPIKIQIQ